MFEKALSKIPQVEWKAEYNPTGKWEGIRALTYEGMPYRGAPTRVFAYYGEPKNAKSVPGIVLIHGGCGDAFCCWVKMWVDRGFAALAMDTVGCFPQCVNAGYCEGLRTQWTREPGSRFLHDGEQCGPDNLDMHDMNLSPEDQWMYHAVSDVILANTLLRSMPNVDENLVGMTGISWGGVIASIAAGYDTRFAFAVPVYGSGYLADSLGILASCFRSETALRLWRAEERFGRIRMPVLWCCWNADPFFSLETNSKSYLATRTYSSRTSLSIVHEMNHSHSCSWKRSEPFLFAEAICEMHPPLPTIAASCEERRITVHMIDASPARLRAFWIEQPLTYSVHSSETDGERLSPDPEWHFADMTENAVFLLPEAAHGYYVEAQFKIDGSEYILATPFMLF